MNQYVVVITLDKVQNFLYQTFKSNTVEHQSEGDTLQRVIQASNELSDRFPRKIKEVFEKAGCSINKENEIIFTSGKIIFYTRLSADKIKVCLQELFRYYYLREIKQSNSKENLQSKGQMKLNYTYFDLQSDEIKTFEREHKLDSKLEDEIRAIKIVTKKFRLSETMTKVIEDNSETLFKFPCEDEIEIIAPPEVDSKLKDGIFAKNIDDLKNELTGGKNDGEDSDFFRIAVIKADLDGMGDLLQSLESYKTYRDVSESLNAFIRIDKLHELMSNQKNRMDEGKTNEYFKLLPFYIAGDDIFFVANVAHIFTAIDLLSRWLRLINEELEEILKHQLTLSVGIDIVAHSLPLRYMYDEVEAQLANAKEYKSDTGNVKMNISMYNQIFHIFKNIEIQISDDDSDEEKEKKFKEGIDQLKKDLKEEKKDFDDGWNKFRREVVLIQKGNDSKIEGTIGFSYLYNLLEKSTMSSPENNNLTYVNAILDQLVPDLKEKSHDNQVKNVLLNQLIREHNPYKTFEERILMFDSSAYLAKFERKLRLFLLFSSERYKVVVKDEAENERNLKSSLILKPTRHLYNLVQDSEIGQMFIKFAQSDKLDEKGIVETDNRGRKIKTDYYQRIPIKTSMFHKLKKLHQKGLIDKSTEAIFKVVENIEQMKEDNEDQKNGTSKLNKSDREYDREFKEQQKNAFIKLANEHKNWNEDVIDSLMILYKYIDVLEYWSEKKQSGGNSNEGNKVYS